VYGADIFMPYLVSTKWGHTVRQLWIF
jgi:hypothetical protein